jgi:hypothetical protein
MPVLSNTAALPRQELALAIVEGEGAVSNLIGEKVLPPFPINRRTAHIIKATLADSLWNRPFDDNKYIHAPGTKFERLSAKFGDDTLTVDLRGVEIPVPVETKLDYQGLLDVETFFANRFGQNSALTKEKLIAAAVFNTTTFGSATNSAVAWTAALGNYANFIAGTGSNPIGDIIASIRRVKAKGEMPDTIVMSGPVWERVRQTFSVLQYIKGIFGPQAEVSQSNFLAVLAGMGEFGIKQLLVGDVYYNNAADGATPSLSQIWSNTYVWVGKAGASSEASQTGGLGVPTIGGAGVNVFWEGYERGGVPSMDKSSEIYAGGNYVETYPEVNTDSMVIRVKMSSKPYVGNSRAGDLIATQYS